jgi:hypothetical protein
LVLEITLTPALSRSTGRGSEFAAYLGIIRGETNGRDAPTSESSGISPRFLFDW